MYPIMLMLTITESNMAEADLRVSQEDTKTQAQPTTGDILQEPSTRV